VYSVGIAVNLEMLEKAGYVDADGTPHQPETFDELAEMAKNIKEKTGNSGFMMPTMSNAGGWRFTPIAWAYGVTFMEQDKDGKWQATFDTPECVAALQWIKDLKWKYDVIPENILIDEGKVRNAFGAGEAAMAFAEGAQAATFVSAGMKKDNIGFIQMPAGPKRHVTLIGGSYNVFNKDATDAQIDAVFEYLDWSGSGRVLNDEIKERIKKSLQTKEEEGKLIGILTASPYTNDDPRRAYEIQLNTVEMANINMNHVKLYNDQSDIEWQQEEPIEAQALYAVLDNAIQAVLTDENADCKALIEEACKNFQATLDVVNNS
nr:extracellular solute-binding protein [Bacillota bacterium]